MLKTKSPNVDQQIRNAILEYIQNEPAKLSEILDDSRFDQFRQADVQRMFYAMRRTGLIVNIAGRQTRGAIFDITRDGRAILEMV